jgi:hypothetical protein
VYWAKPRDVLYISKFGDFRFEPEFENITTEMKVDHFQVYSVKKSPFRIGRRITIHYELMSETEA